MTAKTIIRHPGQPETVSVDSIQIPDLWHVAMVFMDAYWAYEKQQKIANEQNLDKDYPHDLSRITVILDGQQCKTMADMILEVWHLAHDLLNALRAEEK